MRHEVQVELIEQLRADEAPGQKFAQTQIPVELYRDDARLQRELTVLFRGRPQPVAHVSEVAHAGDYVTASVADMPILVVRDQAGALRGFVNVCRHRGAPLAHKTAGQCKAFVCPYHGWVYQLDGGLRHVPGEAFFPDIDKSTLGLVPLSTISAHGFVWVVPEADILAHPGRGAPAESPATFDLDEALGQVGDDFRHFGMAEHHLYRKSVSVRQCNWKLIVDAFLEGYHLQTLHRDSLYRFFGGGRRVLVEFFGANVRSVGGRKNIDEEAEKPRSEWNIRACATPFYLVFPSTVVVVHPDFISLLAVVPMTVDRTMCTHYLLTPAPATDEKQERHYAKSFELIDGVVFQNEDLAIAESIQRGLSSHAYEHFVLGSAEYPIRAFHDNIARALER